MNMIPHLVRSPQPKGLKYKKWHTHTGAEYLRLHRSKY